MKLFLLACLVAAAYAESDAESDPYLISPYFGGYAGHAYAPFAYRGYATGYAGHFNYPYATYGYTTGHFIGKREAEAESDPFFYSAHGLVTPYAHAGFYPGYAHAGFYPYAHHAAVYGPKTYANDAVSPFGYAAKGQYVAANAGAVHVAKREAEAESDPAYLVNPYFGGYARPFAYSAAYARPFAYTAYNSAYRFGYPYYY